MLFGETVAVYCENHTEHINTLWGQNAEFWDVKADGMQSYHWAMKALVVQLCTAVRRQVSDLEES
jgi:hypothetical protein